MCSFWLMRLSRSKASRSVPPERLRTMPIAWSITARAVGTRDGLHRELCYLTEHFVDAVGTGDDSGQPRERGGQIQFVGLELGGGEFGFRRPARCQVLSTIGGRLLPLWREAADDV
jgi:hypothetical protein